MTFILIRLGVSNLRIRKYKNYIWKTYSFSRYILCAVIELVETTAVRLCRGDSGKLRNRIGRGSGRGKRLRLRSLTDAQRLRGLDMLNE